MFPSTLSCYSLMKGNGLSSVKAGEQTEMSFVSVNDWENAFLAKVLMVCKRVPVEKQAWTFRRTSSAFSNRTRSAEREQSQSIMQRAAGKHTSDINVQTFLSALAQDIRV